MNIFVLDKNPRIAAQMHCNTHVVKMILESAQMLSTAHRVLDGDCVVFRPTGGRKKKHWILPDSTREDWLYKVAHLNHPSTIWTRESKENYEWHYQLFVSLCDEYTYRYGKVHSTDTKLRQLLSNPPCNIKANGLTPFRLAMGSNPECMGPDAVESYRKFYKTKRLRFKMVWSKRNTPDWF